MGWTNVIFSDWSPNLYIVIVASFHATLYLYHKQQCRHNQFFLVVHICIPLFEDQCSEELRAVEVGLVEIDRSP